YLEFLYLHGTSSSEQANKAFATPFRHTVCGPCIVNTLLKKEVEVMFAPVTLIPMNTKNINWDKLYEHWMDLSDKNVDSILLH
ncbi:8321_t:CDS:2, partial [Entrophospora sp. SA101]